MATAQDRPVPPQYRIIYNWDGGTLRRSEFPQSVECWLDKTYAPIVDTQVGALFWCVGSHEAEWPSQSPGVHRRPGGPKVSQRARHAAI